MQLCEHITTNYAFDKVFEAAIKRAAWHHCIPELAQIEGQSLDDVLKNTIVNLLNDFADAPALLPVRGIDLLNQRVQAAVLAAAKE